MHIAMRVFQSSDLQIFVLEKYKEKYSMLILNMHLNASQKKIRAGDLVTVRTGNAGVTALVPESFDGCQCFTMLITTLLPSQDGNFYTYLLNSTSVQDYFRLEGWGTAQVNISVPILQELTVAQPPFDEQKEIAEFLRMRTSKYELLTEESLSVISLLQERRSALISAAVTGQIDVRGLAEAVA
nr:hypothetical protein DOP62_11560 [Synechococcus elongatus PCC 11801]